MARKKRKANKELTKFLLIGAAALGATAFVGYASHGFTNWTKDGWQERLVRKADTEEDISEDVSEDVAEEVSEETSAAA